MVVHVFFPLRTFSFSDLPQVLIPGVSWSGPVAMFPDHSIFSRWNGHVVNVTFLQFVIYLPLVVGTTSMKAAVIMAVSWSSRDLATEASPVSSSVISVAFTSPSASIATWIFFQPRRRSAPCCLTFHSPSPTTLAPVESMMKDGADKALILPLWQLD